MATDLTPIVLIPARMASTRLPGKPLADIAGLPMIVQCVKRAEEAAVGPVVVAAGEPEIVAAVEAAGGTALLTRPDHASGSDRIFEALQRFDPQGRHDSVINLQGDLPTIDPALIRQSLRPLADPAVDIATLVVEITDPEERRHPSVVKAAVAFPEGRDIAPALYFSRTPVPWSGPDDSLPLYHHIGLYAYRRAALARFVGTAPTPLEAREKLEQLRALEIGMRIDAVRVDTDPLGVDTPALLERARRIMAAR